MTSTKIRCGARTHPLPPGSPLPAQYANYDYSSDPSIENDFYGGYTGKIATSATTSA